MRKSIKICLIGSISVIVLFSIFIATILLVVSDVEIKVSEDIGTPSVEQTTDDDILAFLESVAIISEDDVYINYDRDIGLFGPEKDKRYIYQRENESYYYIEISPLSYSSYGEYCGYEYKPNEVFYRIDIQDCIYNTNAESMDERISEKLGDTYTYIVNGEKGNYNLNTSEQSTELP